LRGMYPAAIGPPEYRPEKTIHKFHHDILAIPSPPHVTVGTFSGRYIKF
jgi:hypothetical protein